MIKKIFVALANKATWFVIVYSTKVNWSTVVAQHLSVKSPLGNFAAQILCCFLVEEKRGGLNWDSVRHSVIQKYPQFNWNNMSGVCFPEPQSNHTVHCAPIKPKTENAAAITEDNQSN